MSKPYYNKIKFNREDQKYVDIIKNSIRDKGFDIDIDQDVSFERIYRFNKYYHEKVKEHYPYIMFDDKKLDKLIILTIIKYY